MNKHIIKTNIVSETSNNKKPQCQKMWRWKQRGADINARCSPPNSASHRQQHCKTNAHSRIWTIINRCG